MRDLKFRAKVIKPTKPWMNLAPAGSWVVGELHTMSSQPHNRENDIAYHQKDLQA